MNIHSIAFALELEQSFLSTVGGFLLNGFSLEASADATGGNLSLNKTGSIIEVNDVLLAAFLSHDVDHEKSGRND